MDVRLTDQPPQRKPSATKAKRGTGSKDKAADQPTAPIDYGEDDLIISAIPKRSASGLFAVAAGIIVLSLIGAVIFYMQQQTTTAETTPTELNALAQLPSDTPIKRSAPPTNTRFVQLPTLSLATVTPAPPTPTAEPTRGPCMQKVTAGETVISLAIKCGHKDYEVVNLILRINNLDSPSELQLGQDLEIPYPTVMGSTADPAMAAESGDAIASLPEPTLPAGVRWYTVQAGETALSIVFTLNIGMRDLQNLNPELRFEQCEFGVQGGGPDCNVTLYENQKIRVPAALPTATPTVTPNGSETATPTMTATFNAPSSTSPDDKMLFEQIDLPTLRWVASGQLAQNEVYLVVITDQTASKVYTYATRELSFQLPAEWQPTDGSPHVFEWYIVISKLGAGNTAIPGTYSTERRIFTWMSKP